MWTLEDAIHKTLIIENRVAQSGWHVAIAGGVLKKGHSKHDLDLIFWPHDSNEVNLGQLWLALAELGLERSHTYDEVQAGWRLEGSADRKHVEVWWIGKKRIDVIIPSIVHANDLRAL